MVYQDSHQDKRKARSINYTYRPQSLWHRQKHRIRDLICLHKGVGSFNYQGTTPSHRPTGCWDPKYQNALMLHTEHGSGGYISSC